MVGYEDFDVRSWMDRILTVWNEPSAPSRRVTLKSTIRSAIASAAIAAAPVMACPVVTATMLTKLKAPPSASTFIPSAPAVANLVPTGYWGSLVHSMKAWKPVETGAENFDIEPLI